MPTKQQSQAAGKAEWQRMQVPVTAQPFTPEYYQQQREQADLERSHPWGSPISAHPSGWGELAHVASRIGNIAGDALAPRVMAEIPGTDLNKQLERSGQQKGFTAATENQWKNLQGEKAKADVPLEEAQTAAINAKTPWEAPLEQSEVGKNRATVLNLLNPQAKTDYEQWQKQNPNAPVEDWLKLQAANKPHTDTFEEQAYADALKKNPNLTREQFNHNWTPVNQTPLIIPMGEPNAGQIGGTFNPRSGTVTEKTPGATTSAGANLTKPTGQSRSMSEMASSVLEQIPAIKKEVKDLQEQIGPGAGRWNEFWVNKGGIDDPKFAALDTDLDLLASAIVRTHFGARGGQQYREALRKQFGEAQSPDDLISRIDSADKWIKGYADMAGIKPPSTGGAAPNVTHRFENGKLVPVGP
jgi:hypothetical protein